MENNIFLAICPSDSQEVHIKWVHHADIADARAEINTLRGMMIAQNKIPIDCYVYEADKPPYGLPAYLIDEVDMNFYTEKESRKEMMDFERTMRFLQKKALEEEKKNGKV